MIDFFDSKDGNNSLHEDGEDPEKADIHAIDNPLRDNKKRKRKSSLSSNDNEDSKKCGVCYLSRIPPHMSPCIVRQNLSCYGEIGRVYLTPEGQDAQHQQNRPSKFKGKGFSEGWVEFAKKNVAKRVANMLNGEQIGGRRRSTFYYDIWNIRYLKKFKWDDLTREIAEKKRMKEQKLAVEISAAKRERDFYLAKVDEAKNMKYAKERLQKKQAEQQSAAAAAHDTKPKKFRRFPQNLPIVDGNTKKPRLSKEALTGLLGGL